MREWVLFGVLTLMAHTAVASAQVVSSVDDEQTAVSPPDLPIVPGSRQQTDELTDWLKKAKAWQKWDERWRNVATWNWAGQPGERKTEPPAPAWLGPACVD